jgi:transposase
LVIGLCQQEAVYGDETGWKVGGHNAWLWVFTSVEITVYRIDPSRAHGVVEQVLGVAFAGRLVCDCFLAYDPLTYPQQKRLGHLLRTCAQIEESKSRGAVRFSRRVAGVLRAAKRLKERQGQIRAHGYAVACGRLEVQLDRLLRAHLTDPDNARLCRLLQKHRAKLLPFLYWEGVEATNNRAERALRPAVIARKLSAGNRTESGAQTHAILASVMQTCRQQGQDFLGWAQQVLRSPEPMTLPLAGAVSALPP